MSSFHDDIEAYVNISVIFTESFKIKMVYAGVYSWGDIVFYIFANAFKDCSHGIYVQYGTTGKLFNLRRFASKTKTLTTLIDFMLMTIWSPTQSVICNT